MENLFDAARRTLRRHPSPALPYTELHRLICLDRPGPRPDPDALLGRIRARPDLFLTVEPWRGPWRRLTEARQRQAGRYRKALAEAGLPVDVWIVGQDRPPEDELAAPEGLEARLRTSLLGLSRGVDADSLAALARWVLLLREERALRERLAAS